jgi:hypothetical protein
MTPRQRTVLGACLRAALFANWCTPLPGHAASAPDDACGLLTTSQWAELGLSDAHKSNVPAVLPKEQFNTRHALRGTACHVVSEEPQTTPKQGKVTAKETFDVIVFAAAADAEDERRIATALANDLRQAQNEPQAKAHSLLLIPQGLCLAMSIEMLQSATAWCTGVRHGGVLIVSTPERYDASGAYLPMKAKTWFEVVEHQIGLSRAPRQATRALP